MNANEIKEYRTTKEACEKMAGGKICRSCGCPVTPIETVDNSHNPTFWAGCEDCGYFDWGTTQDVFETAKDMVDNQHYVAYSHDGYMAKSDTPEYAYWRKSQIRGACGTVEQILRTHAKVTALLTAAKLNA